jgi:hypothetical protein
MKRECKTPATGFHQLNSFDTRGEKTKINAVNNLCVVFESETAQLTF